MGNKDYFEISDVTCERETAKALLCIIDGKKVWVPKSVVGDDSEVCGVTDEPGILQVAEWFATKEGLV